MSEAVRLKERIVVFMTLAIFGAVFLLCRSLKSIFHIYLAVYNFKNIAVVAAVYSTSEYVDGILFHLMVVNLFFFPYRSLSRVAQ